MSKQPQPIANQQLDVRKLMEKAQDRLGAVQMELAQMQCLLEMKDELIEELKARLKGKGVDYHDDGSIVSDKEASIN